MSMIKLIPTITPVDFEAWKNIILQTYHDSARKVVSLDNDQKEIEQIEKHLLSSTKTGQEE